MRTTLLAASLCATLVAAICCLPTPAVAASANDGVFGINPGDLFKLPPSQWDTNLAAIADDGVQVVRMGAWWSDLEPGPPFNAEHHYSWSELDEQVAALARHGLQWEPLLCFSATWGSRIDGDYNAAPDGPDNFAAFAAALTQRYGRNGSFWGEHPELPALPVTAYEVWNEENAKAYWHPATPEDYADLYAATRSAIHRVDDAARVVVGGLAASNREGVVPADDFLRRMYARRPDLRGAVDAVALHPFAREPHGVDANIAAFREALDDIAGPGVPIEITEIGWTTVDVSESNRADYLSELASTLPRTNCGIERVIPYAWIGPEQDASDREQWFGIANHDGTPKPSASAYADAVKLMRGLSGTRPTNRVPICTAAHAPLRVRVKVTSHRHARRLVVLARCSRRCRLHVELRVPQHGQPPATAPTVRVAQRTTRHSARRQRMTLTVARRIYRHTTQLGVNVTATGRDGRSATRWHTLRVPRS